MDDLERNGYKIIQNKEKFCFGMDAVLLSGFVKVQKGEQTLDLGTGTGIIPILLAAKTEGKHFSALEIQKESADMAKRSVMLNHLEERIEIVCDDIKNASAVFGKSVFDVVTCNPPYINDKHGLKNPALPKAVARHEILCSLEDVISQTALVLKPNGRFYMVHRPHRLIEIITVLTKYKLEPKRIKFVHPYIDREANMVLIEAVRGGKPMVKLEAPIVVFKEEGIYSDEIKGIYGY